MKKIFLSLISLFVLNSCSKDENSTANLTLALQGLEDLGSNYVYEGWLMVNGSPVSSGRFSVNASGQLSQTLFPVPSASLNAATAFILTIEPATNDNPTPSDVHILAGDFSGNKGNVSVAHSAALGNNFSTASGKYILATPTDGGETTNEESGIWFLEPTAAGMAKGLNLPTLPAGWKYEGWVVFNGIAVSTGTFTDASKADDNASTSAFKGTSGNGPAFPGEDFLKNAPSGLTFPTDLRGKTIAISIEPSPDNSTAPFLLKPLLNTIPTTANVSSIYSMTQNLSSLPSGSFSR